MTQSGIATPRSAICGNCAAVTISAYCPDCGQDTKREPPTISEYFQDLLNHFVHFDGKLWRTFGPLFFQPGKLPSDYLANKRQRYVKPLRLYFAAIALAFAAFQFLGWDLALRIGGPAGFHLSLDLMRQTPPHTSVAQDRLVGDSATWVLEHVDTPGIRRLNALTPAEQFKVTRERGMQHLPYLTLALVPLYAVLLQWVYRSRHRRYAAHLVFGLYAHSFLLLIFVIEAKLPLAIATMLSTWAIVYYALSLKRVYGGSWSETIGRATMLTILYFLASLSIGLLVTIVVLSL